MAMVILLDSSGLLYWVKNHIKAVKSFQDNYYKSDKIFNELSANALTFVKLYFDREQIAKEFK